MPFRFSRVFFALFLLACLSRVAQAQPTKPSAPVKSEARLTPTKDARNRSGVYIPKDLTDSLKELRHLLPPTAVAQMTRGTENEMYRYHLGLGMWLRNNWELWRGSRLSRWFNNQGIFHPDDMSGIVLISFWRSLHKRPIQLEAQVAHYKAYWEAARKAQVKETQRVQNAKAEIRQRMLGFEIVPAGPDTPEVSLPESERGLRVRYAAPFFGGVLLTAKASAGKEYDDFITPAYVLDVAQDKLYRVQLPEIERIENAVVLDGGNVICFHGTSAVSVNGPRKDILLTIDKNGRRRPLPVPPGTGTLRLGLGTNGTLLAVRPKAVFRWSPGSPASPWTTLYSARDGDSLPHSGVPPQIWGDRLYFRDEGRYEDDKRLSWLDLKASAPKVLPRLVYFDDDTHLVGSEGPRWENVWSYGVVAGSGGTVWIATGNTIGAQTLIRWTPDQGYRVALYNDSTRFNGEFFGKESWKNFDPAAVSIMGIETPAPDGGIHAVGLGGIYAITGAQIKTLVRFHSPSDLVPTHLLTLSANRYLVGGHFGGLYLLKPPQGGNGSFQVVLLDDSPIPPLRF